MASRPSLRVVATALYFLPYELRLPLRFGSAEARECLTARVRLEAEDAEGSSVTGWGECPLGADWAWPSALPCAERSRVMREFCLALASAWTDFKESGHALELGWIFLRDRLPDLLSSFNLAKSQAGEESLPYLAALVCAAPFDLALHDAYGKSLGLPSLKTLGPGFLGRDLAWFFGEDAGSAFSGRYPEEFLLVRPKPRLAVWHLVGGADPLEDEAEDGSAGGAGGEPLGLRPWIRRGGIRKLKLKLLGEAGDRERFLAVGRIALEEGIDSIGVDFNGTLSDLGVVEDFLDWLELEHPRLSRLLSYIEQPLDPRDTHTRLDRVSARIPILLDEGAPDWRVLDGASARGWNGLALKTCKTLTGSLLSLCRAKAAGMALMVQDLTNPMLAFFPHVLLAAHAETLGGVEANAAQFCPAVSAPEAALHPGLFERRDGGVDLEEILASPGLGYAGAENARVLPPPAWEGGRA